jgi:hypothetical protein
MSERGMSERGMSERGMSERGMSEDSHSTPGDLTIDCASCLARPAACGDCIVSVLLGPPGQIGGEEQAAFAVLAGSGLVPPLRLVKGEEGVA